MRKLALLSVGVLVYVFAVALPVRAEHYQAVGEPTPADDSDVADDGAAGEIDYSSPCCECCPLFDECPDWCGVHYMAFAGFDSWRSVPDGSYQNNDGLHVGVNASGPVVLFDNDRLGWQLGASFGVYDWNGRESSFDELDETAQQVFITAGFFQRAGDDSPWSAGAVVDQMIANNFGVFSNEPYLVQARYQIGYALSERNEIGFWGTNQLNMASQEFLGVIDINTRAVSQANIFWHHKFELGADTWLYCGVPTNGRINDQGTLGDFIFGASFTAPLNDRWAVYGNLTYLDPSAPSALAAEEDSFNISIGLAWYPGANARSRTVAGRRWLPYLPIANNGSFIVDQNVTF